MLELETSAEISKERGERAGGNSFNRLPLDLRLQDMLFSVSQDWKPVLQILDSSAPILCEPIL